MNAQVEAKEQNTGEVSQELTPEQNAENQNSGEVKQELTPEQIAENELKAIAADEKELEELAKKISTGKATTPDFIRLSELSSQKAKREQKKEGEATANKLLHYIKENLKLDIATAINLLKPHLPVVAKPQSDISGKEALIRYVDEDGKVHERLDGEKVVAKWAKTMAEKVPFDKAQEFIVATSTTGKNKATAHLKKLYKIKE